jgi:hypothetical protein
VKNKFYMNVLGLLLGWTLSEFVNKSCDGMTYDEVKKNKSEDYESGNTLISLLFFFLVARHVTKLLTDAPIILATYNPAK